MKNARITALPTITFEITFFDLEGNEESVQQHTNEADARAALELFNEPDSAELYSRITLSSFNWSTGTERTMKTLTF